MGVMEGQREGGSVEMRAQGKKGRRREREKERGMERSRDGGRQKAGIRRGRWSESDQVREFPLQRS